MPVPPWTQGRSEPDGGAAMTSELWQFAGFVGVVGVTFALWMGIIYLPRRTLEHRYDARGGGLSDGTPYASQCADDEATAESTCRQDAPNRSASDPTR